MESISSTHGDNARYGGVDITISLTPLEAQALGLELGDLTDWFDSALWGIAMLRTGANPRAYEGDPATRDVTAGRMHEVITDLDHRLLPRLGGLRDAAVRRHQELGGSLPDLAQAMDVVKSTAQSRRNVITNGPASAWEQWATSGGPQHVEH